METFFTKYREAIFGERISDGTRRCYLAAWRQRISPTFGTVALGEITSLDIKQAVGSWVCSASSKRDALSLLSRIFKSALSDGIVNRNPVLGVELSFTKEFRPNGRALTRDETEKLIKLLPSEGEHRNFVLGLLYTGCRFGELSGIRVRDIYWDEQIIAIERAIKLNLQGQTVVGDTKNHRSRSVPIHPYLEPVLKQALAGKREDDFVFTGPRNGHLTSRNLARAIQWSSWRNSVKKFPDGQEQLRFHDLRHTYAVRSFEYGIPAPDVQSNLGHSSLAVTQIYANTRADAAKRSAALLRTILDDSNKDSAVNSNTPQGTQK